MLRVMRELSKMDDMTTDAGAAVPTLEQFGARLALIRWQQGWNQKEAALACQLPQGTWRDWELSGRMPRNLAEVAEKISEATGVDQFWIMTGRSLPGSGDGLRTRRDSNPQPSDMESPLNRGGGYGATRPRSDQLVGAAA